MTLPAIKPPVELLRDGKGIYGIGVAEAVDTDNRPRDLILRSDRVVESEPLFTGNPVLQMITGGFRHGMFCHTAEDRLRQVIHHEMLCRAGLVWPPMDAPDGERVIYWSSDPQRQTRNREIYHGLRLGSLSVVNRLIGRALEEAANQEALKVARRFRFHYRYGIYRAMAQSPRALQLAVTFPALAFAIFQQRHPFEERIEFPTPGDFSKRLANLMLIGHEAATLVEAGAPLKTIADLMSVPMAFRKLKPGAITTSLSWLVCSAWDKRLIHAYMPNSLPRMNLWLNAVSRSLDLGPDFVEWVAKHGLQIPGCTSQVINSLFEVKDWVQACHRARIVQHRDACRDGTDFSSSRGEEFVARLFSPDMSLKTVTKLTSEWHEAVANNMSGPRFEFPEPWCCAGEQRGYEVIPITNSAELYREGHALHHCVGTQGDRVRFGEAYFFSIRKDTERVATLELLRHSAGVTVGQLRGSCNSLVPKEIRRAVKEWLRSQRAFRLPKERGVALRRPDDEIPF